MKDNIEPASSSVHLLRSPALQVVFKPKRVVYK